MREELICKEQHAIARQYCSSVVPLCTHSWHTATQVGIIHYIIVYKSVVMVRLKRQSRIESFIKILLIHIICHKEKHRSHTLSPLGDSISYGFIKSVRLSLELQIVDKLIYLIPYFIPVVHSLLSVLWIIYSF